MVDEPSRIDFKAEMKKRCPRVFEDGPGEMDVARQHEQEEYRRQQEQQQRIDLLAALELEVGQRHKRCSFENYQIEHEEQRPIVADLRAYVKNARQEIRAGNGIVLFGGVGTGKDHLLVATARPIVWIHGVDVRWVYGLDVYGEFRDAMDSDERERSLVHALAGPTVLIISDPLPPRGELTSYQSATLLRILDRRYRACKPTWASLNVANAKEADARIGPAIVDRLRHGALDYKCTWPSFRASRPTPSP